MATIRKLKEKYQVIIRKGKYKGKPLVKSFSKLTLAKQWAAKKEAEIEAMEFVDMRSSSALLFTNLIIKYQDEYISTLSPNTQKTHEYIIGGLVKYFEGKRLEEVDATAILDYIKLRVKSVKPDTIIKELHALTAVFKFCQTVWGIAVKKNEAKEARSIATSLGLLKNANVQRISRLTDNDYEKIRRYQASGDSLVKYACLLAIETGMRRSEITNMLWQDVDLLHGVYHLPKEKSDHTKKIKRDGRIVPLTFRAKAILRLLRMEKRHYPYVWGWRDPSSLSRANAKMLTKLNIKNIRLHDYRHEFGSTQADNQVDMRITAAAMGHSDLRSMARYSHPDMIKHAKMIKGKR